MDPAELTVLIAETPAPTFHEGERAALVARTWAGLGLHPELDAAGNVLVELGSAGRVPGGSAGRVPGEPGRARLCLAAHLDTVFPAGTDLRVRREGERLVGPGVGDNAASLAVLTSFAARAVARGGAPGVLLAATTGEEGLGDLRGAKALLGARAGDIDAFVAVDGYLGLIMDRSVGVRRHQATFRTAGGHSWGNASAPSAVRALGEAVRDLYALPLSSDPRATLNVGTVAGGTSVNSIASHAELLLDLRSTDGAALDALDASARRALEAAARRAGAELDLRRVGDRPAGETENGPLVRAAARALELEGVQARRVASSTDANAAVPYHLPALGLGVYRGGNAHRPDEWVETASLHVGLRVLEAFVRELAA